MFPTAFGTDFQHFMAWVSTLDASDLRDAVGETTAALFLDRVATLVTPREALELAMNDEGTLLVPIRGVRQANSAVAVAATPVGEALQVRREYDNAADVNAIRVHTAGGVPLGYIAREVARVLAPLLDLEGGPTVTAVLATRPTRSKALMRFKGMTWYMPALVLTLPEPRRAELRRSAVPPTASTTKPGRAAPTLRSG